MDVESLLGRFADCARRCRMLSTELKGRAAGEPFVGEPGLENDAVGSVGVGGVMRVVGVCSRFGGVAGNVVSKG